MSIKRGWMKSASERRDLDRRGTKRSGVSALALALFENLEWRLQRSFARSFLITPSRAEILRYPDRKVSRDFKSLDAKLIYTLVKVVFPSAAIETVQSALKSMPAKKSSFLPVF